MLLLIFKPQGKNTIRVEDEAHHQLGVIRKGKTVVFEQSDIPLDIVALSGITGYMNLCCSNS